jgi:hypothetical protein
MPLEPFTASLIAGAIPGAIGGLSSLFGRNNIQNNETLQQYRNLYDQLGQEQRTPYMQSSEIMNIINQMNTQRKKKSRELKGLRGQGMTDEAMLAGMDDMNEQEANIFSNFAGMADQRKRGLRQDRMNTLSSMFNLENSFKNRQAQNIQNVVTPISSALGTWQETLAYDKKKPAYTAKDFDTNVAMPDKWGGRPF